MLHGNQKLQKAYQRKCPNCGAPLTYDPTSGKLSCSHCKGLVDFEQSKDVKERDFAELDDFTRWDEGAVAAYRCANCGASSVVSRTTLATTCPFCSSPVVIDEKVTGLVRPDSLVPFEVSEQQATDQLARWCKNKLYAPNKFRKRAKAHAINGVYVPVWTFDAETVSLYDGTLGKHKTRTVRRDGKTYNETYTDWFHVSGSMPALFDDIMIRGSNNISAPYFAEVERLNKSKYKVYSDEYLAGYFANNYTVEPTEAYKSAHKIMDNAIRDKIVRKYNADVEGHLNVNTAVVSRSFKYMLFPLYVAATKYKGKLYNQYVAGFWTDTKQQRVHVSGNYPKAGWKIALTVIAGVLALAGFVGLVAYLLLRGGAGFGGFDIDFDFPFGFWGRSLTNFLSRLLPR